MDYRDALRKGLTLGHVRVAVHVHRANTRDHRAFNIGTDGVANVDGLTRLCVRKGKGSQVDGRVRLPLTHITGGNYEVSVGI